MSATVVTIHEAKTHLSRLIQRALEGEEIVIARRDQPLVRLEVLRTDSDGRRFGGLPGLVLAMDDTFDDELADFDGYAPPAEHHRSRVAEDERS